MQFTCHQFTCHYCGFKFRWAPYRNKRGGDCCSEAHQKIANAIIDRMYHNYLNQPYFTG